MQLPTTAHWKATLLPERLLVAYLAALVGFILYYQLATPIFVSDTDMWYHLNGGRYFWTEGRVPDSTFFSFLDPARQWTNYFWGFQAIVFKVFDLSSYQGLIAFRASIHVATTLVLILFLFDQPKVRRSPLLAVAVLVLAVLILASRQVWVRPHIISFLLIPVFIYVLESRRRLAPLLPLLAILWVNLHGKEWVVGALICGAYLIEDIFSRWRLGEQAHPLPRLYVLSVLACAPALLVNPHGLSMLFVPFETEQDLFLFINELQRLPSSIFLNLSVSLTNISLATALTLLAGIEAVAFGSLLIRGRLRISHAILASGGLFLLTHAARFTAEWTLLSLPLIRAFLIQSSPLTGGSSAMRLAIAAYFSVMPFATLIPKLSVYSQYPFDPQGLPVGVTRFLKQPGVRGSLLAPPSDAGYSQWELYPEILIFSDMEFPPFSATEMFIASHSLFSPSVLGHLLDTYSVDFIAVPLASKGFPAAAEKFPNLVPVFFDDVHVLYANKATQPDLAAKDELKHVDPFNLTKGAGSIDQRLSDMERVAAVHPEGRRVIHGIVYALFQKKQYEESLAYAYKMAKYHPLDPNSHYWIANNLENLGRCAEASKHYLDAMKVSDNDFKALVKRHLGTCAYLTKDFQASFSYFEESINPYRFVEAPEDLYQYAFAATVVGETDKAKRLLDLLLISAAADDESLTAKARSLRERISSDEFAEIGLGSWLRSLVR